MLLKYMRTSQSRLTQALHLARSKTLGIDYLTVEEMIEEADGDIEELRRIVLKYYGINADIKNLRKNLTPYEKAQLRSN